MKKAIVLLAILALVIWLVAAAASIRKADAANVSVDIYAYDSQGLYFFTQIPEGPHNPTLVFTEGDVVTVTLHNMGGTFHGWQIIASYPSDPTVLFGAQTALIGSGSQTTVVFTVTQPGSFDYICPVAGHAGFGMLGQVTVNVIPEYPSAAVLAFFMISMLLLIVAYKSKLLRPKPAIAQQ